MYRGEPAEISWFSCLVSSFVLCNIFIFCRSFLWKSVARKIFKTDHLKAQACLSKIFFYGFTSIYGYLILRNESWSSDVNQYHFTYGYSKYPLKIYFYYLFEFSFYLTEFLYLFTNYDKKDQIQLIVHHIATLTLLSVSFINDFSRVGIIVMALHDVSDPILESSKLFVYMNKIYFANIGFILFTFVFILSRIIFYPYIILYPTYKYIKRSYTFDSYVCAGFLYLLYFLHIYWSFMIGKTFKKIFVSHEYKDARSQSVVNQGKE